MEEVEEEDRMKRCPIVREIERVVLRDLLSKAYTKGYRMYPFKGLPTEQPKTIGLGWHLKCFDEECGWVEGIIVADGPDEVTILPDDESVGQVYEGRKSTAVDAYPATIEQLLTHYAESIRELGEVWKGQVLDDHRL